MSAAVPLEIEREMEAAAKPAVGREHRHMRLREVRKTTLRVGRSKKADRAEIEAGRALYPEPIVDRPRTRSDCVDGPRPCPYVGCAFSLFLDVNRSGSLALNFPDLEPDEISESCALDVADRGGATLEEVGAMLNLTRERIRQVEVMALARMALRGGARLREHADEGAVPKRRLPVLQRAR